MKLNKIVSSLLLAVILFTAVIAIIPTRADAAYVSNSTGSASLSTDQIKAMVGEIYLNTSDNRYAFETAEQMLRYEQQMGYLNSVSTPDKQYSIFVNKYTGILYYVNNLTGQILTSNPTDYTVSSDNVTNEQLMSQIVVEFTEIATGYNYEYNSTKWAALYTQISTEFINGGIRVNYTLGDTTARFLLPGRMVASKFEPMIMEPMLKDFAAYMEEYFGDADFSNSSKKVRDVYDYYKDKGFNFFDYDEVINTSGKKSSTYEYGCINSRAYKAYFESMELLYTYNKTSNPVGLRKNTSEDREKYSNLNTLKNDFLTITTVYSLKNLSEFYDEEGYETDKAYLEILNSFYTPNDKVSKAEVFETLEPMYVFPATAEVAKKRTNSLLFQKYAGEYTFNEMYQDEKYCGYVDATSQKPVFRCALEYTFNEDGSLSVRLPANSISFDETTYNLSSISPLKFFGAGDLTEDGYIFYPDGSGTIVAFDDFNDATVTANLASPTYGKDFCYSNIEGAHREQISMPVYGVVTGDYATDFTKGKYGFDKITNGYFAILEEGSSLASLGFETGGAAYHFASAYCTYSPYPSDKYDLSETISVGGSTSYTMVSDSKYTGSYVTRIVMLADDRIAAIMPDYYEASYSGMAAYYRDYLYANGTLSALEAAGETLPLYIEALGSMEIIKKILSFPVTTKLALTTFDDIATMYGEISDVAKVTEAFDTKIAEYRALAENAKAMADDADRADIVQRYLSMQAEYLAYADKFEALKSEITEITTVNFRLTGFGNGGLYNTYPTKVRWDRACGGKKAFNRLVETSASLAAEGKTLGIYPDYDFMYINYTEMFDGISVRGNVSRMVDNRYASKQVYNSVMREYESFYTLVINPSALDKLYSKFLKQYSKYDISTISVSTMGSDLNSNFDEDEPINRDDAQSYVTEVLDRMVNENGYEVMVDIGNIYSVKYASHILNIALDSSHFRYSSYAVPFVGMVLHGSKLYAGTPLNYSGAPEYDLLRAIESGANPYYILCYQNSTYMKEDVALNSYYGVDYQTWYQDMVLTYTELNAAIGDLQNYTIVDHRVIIAERVIEEDEMDVNRQLLEAEFLTELERSIEEAIDAGYDYLAGNAGQFGVNLTVTLDKAALVAHFCEISRLDEASLDAEFLAGIDALSAKYAAEYPAKDQNDYVVNVSSTDYESKYSFFTNSVATDGDYVYTDFTSDINNVVLVTYSNGTDTVQFILNYNIYEVNVNLGDGKEYTLGMYEYVRIG